MDLIQKANKLGYKHYTEFTIEELDNLPLGNSNKQIEYYFIQKWIREVHNIHITIFSQSQESWMYRITKKGQKLEDGLYGEDFYTYEEALEEGLYQALLLI